MEIVILAAGQGKRMQSSRPKVLQPLAGQPLLSHVLNSAAQLKPQHIIVVYGHGGDVVKKHFSSHSVTWVEQTRQLGTGHAAQQAMPQVRADVPVLLLYGDVPLVRVATLQRLVKEVGIDSMGLLTAVLDNPQGYGRIVRNAQGVIEGIVEEKDTTDTQRNIREVNSGMMAVSSMHLRRWLAALKNDNAQGEYYLTDIIAMANAEGISVKSIQPDEVDEIYGVNDKTQLATLERRYQRRYAAALMQQGVTLIDPARIDIRGTLQCGRDVEIDIDCIFSGTVTIGAGSRIGAHCVLHNVTIGEGCEVKPFSHLDGTTLAQDCKVGPYARLRPGTHLLDGVHVGNFVEIKNSQLGCGSKAGHLSYLGDATVGARVNIGAGTITCNYDGANKHQTSIGDDVFVGSDTQLIAPVMVGAGATIGAGTAVAKDVPAAALAVSRAPQKIIANWHRPTKK